MKPVGWRRAVQRVLYLAAVLVFAVLLVRHWGEIWRTVAAHKGTVMLVVLLGIAGLAFQAANFRWFLARESRIPLLLVLRIWAMAGLMSHVLPLMGGTMSRWALLKAEGVTLADSITATIAQTLTMTAVTAALLSVLIPFSQVPVLRENVTFYSIAAATLLVAILAFWRIRRVNMSGAIAALPTLVLSMLTVAISLYLVLDSIGALLGFTDAFLLSGTVFLSSLVNITPNNIGPLDAWLAAAAVAAGANSIGALTMILILRLSYIVACGVILLFGSLYPLLMQRLITSKSE